MKPKEAYEILEAVYRNPNHPLKNYLENTISQIPELSYHYSRDIIKKRFILGENTISKDPYFSYCYAKHIVKGKLPENMHNAMIAHSIKDSKEYNTRQYFIYIKLICNKIPL
jgi:hypothetical protein